MVTILISNAFRGAALLRRRHLFQCDYPKVRRLLEGGAYLRPGAYQRKYDNLLNSSSRIQKFMGFKEKNYFLIALSIQTLITVLSYDIFALRNH